ncbi:MAG: hypothetical protein JRI67_11270 [Deltaproteobacteria bacterium]|nr:hypothetical protein [Deltaproteobacteria bacterium]
MNDEQVSIEKILTEPDYDYEGFVDYIYDGDTYKLWYGIIGSGSGPSALVLHGGPGGNWLRQRTVCVGSARRSGRQSS